MAEDTQQDALRPILIQYTDDVEPTDRHPTGFRRGETFEVASPEIAWDVHPKASVLRYVDGASYSDRKARQQVRERDADDDKPASSQRRRNRPSRRRTAAQDSEPQNGPSGDSAAAETPSETSDE